LSDARATAAAATVGAELAVHGIDAWRGADAARAELEALRTVTGSTSTGIRMHWLYFDAGSPAQLEAAGFTYDSTCGYNDAVGYKAGTSQVFRLPGAAQLMELPLSVMDSAMFFPRRMGLTRTEGQQRCRDVIENARRFGGTVVINWHDRSLVPDRLWGDCYRELVSDLEREDRVWFATAHDAVAWYRWRRSMTFNDDGSGSVRISAAPRAPELPGTRITVRRHTAGAGHSSDELIFDGRTDLRLAV
jgi:hypothetical protein